MIQGSWPVLQVKSSLRTSTRPYKLLITIKKTSARFPRLLAKFENKARRAGFVVMEFVNGVECCKGTFEQLKDKTAAREIMDSFIEALTTMWDDGWAHGDHNGDNLKVFLSNKKPHKHLVKLMDFGLAQKESDDNKVAFMEAMRDDATIAYAWSHKAGLISNKFDEKEQEKEPVVGEPYSEVFLPLKIEDAKKEARAFVQRVRQEIMK